MSLARAVLAMIVVAGCDRTSPPAEASPQAAVQVAPVALVAPVAKATAGDDLRVMLSELASSRACGMLRGLFNGLRAPGQPGVVTGVLWIRECDAANAGTQVTFHIRGNGWLWVDQTQHKAGGTFAVRQYVRFGIDATIRGLFDIGYERRSHVMAISFTPSRTPEVEFTTIGDVDVDRQTVWSSIVGAVGTAFTTSPEDAAAGAAKAQGTKELAAKLADGLTVTVNLCTGLLRVHIGRLERGQMAAADVGETRKIPVEVQPGGMVIVGPQLAGDGLTLQAEGLKGAARLTVLCAKHADVLAAEFLGGRSTSKVPTLGSVDIRTKAKLRIKPTSCPIVVMVTPLDNAPARFAWERPASEIAHSTGGALIHCQAAPKAK